MLNSVMTKEHAPHPLRIGVITVSDTRTLETDKSGRILEEFVRAAGHQLVHRLIIKDDVETIRQNVREQSSSGGVDVILITGGTGITGRDVTPEALAPLVTKEIPGFGELFRMLSYAEIGAATIQSRALAALCAQSLVFALPGSTGAVELAVSKIIGPQLDASTKPCNFVQLLPRVRED